MKTSKLLASALVVVAAIALAAVASAGERIHEPGKIKLWVPDKWKVEVEDDMMTISDPKEEIAIMFIMLGAENFEAAMDEMEKAIDELVKDFKPDGEPEELKINGLDAFVFDATGKLEGTPVALSVMLVHTPANKILLVFGMAEAAKLSRHEAEVMKILKSIKKL